MSSFLRSRVFVAVAAAVAVASAVGCSSGVSTEDVDAMGGDRAAVPARPSQPAPDLAKENGTDKLSGTCDHDVCEPGASLAQGCDACVDQICLVDSFCCTGAWDYICVNEVATVCGQQCPVECGDGLCQAGEDCSTCEDDCGACPVCGDGICNFNTGETCSTCEDDCGACPVCGDGTCDFSAGETCSTCEDDCGACPSCGDGTCNGGETCGTCDQDCGACVCHDECATGPALDASCGQCEAQVCALDPYCCTTFWDGLCVNEVATACGQACAPTCGDGLCNGGESCSDCAQDCGACPVCGDSICQWPESCTDCAQDCGACPTCGDGVCDWTETCTDCSADCGACPVCGDGTCDWNESCGNCSADCGACPVCGDGTCDWNETCSSCNQDCGACVCHDKCAQGPALDASCGQCEAQVCAADSFCCQSLWDSICVSEVSTVCGLTCP